MKHEKYSTTDTKRSEQVNAVANFFVGLAKDRQAALRKRRIRVAAQLSAMIAALKFSHSKVSAKSGIKPSQLSRQLSGDTNLTLDTISRICDAVGTDFDVVFRKAESAAAKQWWEQSSHTDVLETDFLKNFSQKIEECVLRSKGQLEASFGQSGQVFKADYPIQASNDEAQSIAA